MKISSVLLLLASYCTTNTLGFTTQSTSHSSLSNTPFLARKTTTKLNAIDPNLVIDNIHHLSSTTSTLLADASAAAVDAAEKEPGWFGSFWNGYLNVYKTCLLTVHNTIDAPLRDSSIGWTQTWGIAIFLFTTAVRTALLPLSIQQTKSAEYIKALKPYQDEIKEKFKDNKDMLNRATAKLFEDANANPLSGCLISILQLPILIGLYRSITLLAKDGELAEPFLWIPSLEGPVSAANDYRGMEWLTEGWVNGVPSMGWETTLAFMIMPVVLVLGQSLTMNLLTPNLDEENDNMSAEEKATAERTQTIFKFLPLMIGYFSLQVPAGLTIYWFTSNVYSLVQSLIIRGYYKANPPNIELPDYWDALDDVSNMSPEEKRKAAEAGMAVGPKWEDLLDEAQFHYRVDRPALRESSKAWERASSEDLIIPPELVAWIEDIAATAAAIESKKADDTKSSGSDSKNSTQVLEVAA